MYPSDPIRWYAVKIYAERTSILKYLIANKVEIFIPMKSGKPFLGPITFLHCTENTLLKVKADWFHVLFIYRDLELKGPQPIPDSEMNNFRMVMNLQGQEIIPLVVHSREFLEGQKVRVLDGPFKGAEGVIKRIKGDRRLIVSIAGVAAVATSFIHPDFLEKINQ